MKSMAVNQVIPLGRGSRPRAKTSTLASGSDAHESGWKTKPWRVSALLGMAVFAATMSFLETSASLSCRHPTAVALSSTGAVLYTVAFYRACVR